MHLLPTTGSEPRNISYYENNPKAVRRNNCMSFAFGEKGRKDFYKQQPGNKSGLEGVNFSLKTCDQLVQRVLRDYKKKVYLASSPQAPCKTGYAKVLAFIAKDADFHFYRQEPNGMWAHKRGLTPVTRKDACGKRIANPLKSCRDFGNGYDYSLPCGTFCRKTSTRPKTSAGPKPKTLSTAAQATAGTRAPARRGRRTTTTTTTNHGRAANARQGNGKAGGRSAHGPNAR